MILLKNAMNFFIKVKFNLFHVIIIYLFFFSIASYCSDLEYSIEKLKGFSFNNKNFFYSIKEKEIYVIKNNCLFIKKPDLTFRAIKFNFDFKIKGFIFNSKYFIFYGINDLVVFSKSERIILWKKKFNEKIYLKPIVYYDRLFLNLDFNKIISFNLISGDINWQFINEFDDYKIYTDIKFIQSKNFIYYICANHQVTVIDKESGYLFSKYSISPIINFDNCKNFKIKRLRLFNSIIYVSYDNGILGSFDSYEGNILWIKKIKLNDFIIYKDFIIGIKPNGFIFLMDRFTGDLLRIFSILKGKNIKKIKNYNHFIYIFDNKSLYIFDYFNDNFLNLVKTFNIKLENIVPFSFNSVFLISKNKFLKLLTINRPCEGEECELLQ